LFGLYAPGNDDIIEVREVKKLQRGGQSIIEYVIIFAVVAVLSVTMLFPKIPKIFSDYVKTASEKMTGVAQ
jgi:hypothetical protein